MTKDDSSPRAGEQGYLGGPAVVALLPCPFCGEDDACVKGGGRVAYVDCLACGATGPEVTGRRATADLIAGAEAAWNRRAAMGAQPPPSDQGRTISE
jgi:Lar family restriction alleviation protein